MRMDGEEDEFLFLESQREKRGCLYSLVGGDELVNGK